MQQTPLQQLADMLLGRPVVDFIAERRADGRPWRFVARDLYEATNGQVDVTYENVPGVAPRGRGMSDLVGMTEAEARARVDRVKAAVATARDDLVSLWRERAWLSLGYLSWDELCDAEFGVRMSLPRVERPAIVAGLRAEGMSTRAIGSALGMSEPTVRRDLSTASYDAVEPPARITGLDGRHRPAIVPRTPVERADVITGEVLDHPLLTENPARQDAEYRRNLIGAVDRVFALCQYDVQRTADVIEDDHARLIEDAAAGVAKWAEEVRRRRNGLRIVNGGKS